MVYKFFEKKIGSRISANDQLAEAWHKPVNKKFKRRKVYARFNDYIWEADLAEIESLSSRNINVNYILYVIDVCTKYAWVKPLKDKKGKTFLNVFTETVNESNRILSDQNMSQWAKFFSTPILYTTDTEIDSLKNFSKKVVQKNGEVLGSKIADVVTPWYYNKTYKKDVEEIFVPPE